MHDPIKILVVDDIASLRMLFKQSLNGTFPNSEIIEAANLEQARELLKVNSFDAIISDCGFPTTDEKVREEHNRNGPLLIGEIRRGDYGQVNARCPIAFNSAEITPEKKKAALAHGGNTQCFKKGSLYGGLTRGKLTSNFTVESVARESTKWLESELTEAKISERRKIEQEPSNPPPRESFLSRLLGGSKAPSKDIQR